MYKRQAQQRAGGQPHPQRSQFVREPLSAGGGCAEPAAEPVLQLQGVADPVPGESGAQRGEVGVEVPSGLRGPGQGPRGADLAVRCGGHQAVQAGGRVRAGGDGVGFVEGVRRGAGDGSGDHRAGGGEDVEGVCAQQGPLSGGGEADHGGGPAGGQQRAGQVDEDGRLLGEHLGGAEDEVVVGPVDGVAPALVADDEQPGGLGGLARLAHQLGRRHGRGRVVGDRQQQHPRVAALGAHPPYGLQQGVGVRYAAALGGGGYVVGPPAEQPDLRGPPGGAGPGQHHVAPVRPEEGQEQRRGAGARRHALRGGGQSAPAPVPAGGLAQRCPAARGLGRGTPGGRAEDGDQFGEHGQARLRRGRAVADRAAALRRRALHPLHRCPPSAFVAPHSADPDLYTIIWAAMPVVGRHPSATRQPPVGRPPGLSPCGPPSRAAWSGRPRPAGRRPARRTYRSPRVRRRRA